MLQPDGLEVSFVHRSFQEYFAAVFATSLPPDRMKPVLDKYCLRFNESVMPMLLDMHKETVEQGWVVPTIVDILQIMEIPESRSVSAVVGRFSENLGLRFFSHEVDGCFFDISPDGFNRELFARLHMILRLYPRFVSSAGIFGDSLISIATLRTCLIHPKYASQMRYREIKRALAIGRPVNRKPRVGRAIIATQPIGPADDWWLEELGFRERIEGICTSLHAILSDIKVRALQRESILKAFV